MARWGGWGAGPAGAGSAPSRVFLGALLVGCAIVTGVLLNDGRLAGAAVAGLGTIYFALRLFAGLGR